MKPVPILVATDVVLFGIGPEVSVLLIQRKNEPFKDAWALPGGFVDPDEDLMQAALRELVEETSVEITNAIQVGAYGNPGRDPRGRVVSIAYTAHVEITDVKPKAADDAKKVAWHPLKKLPELAFDHARIISDAAMKYGLN